MSDTITSELDGIDLGDKRLDKRSRLVLQALHADCTASVNSACQGWAETLAAYRFFDNPNVSPEAILRPHQDASIRRIREHPLVVIAQDTTELDFTAHPAKDARCLNRPERKGLYQHTHLALTPGGLPLGVLGQSHFDRAAETLGKTADRDRLPIERKESFRWLRGYRSAGEVARDCPGTRVVSVADSEADIYDIFAEARDNPGPAKFVIRAKEPRCTTEPDPEGGEAAYRKVADEVAAAGVMFVREVRLNATPKREARDARLEVRAATVRVKAPHARGRMGPAKLNVVLAEEAGGPGDGTDVRWLLISDMPIDTAKAVGEVVDCYVARWGVEVYFRALKTGCAVEELRLESTARLGRCLALYAVVAWRVMYATYLGRECPEVPCSAVFEGCEWKAVWAVARKCEPPREAPSLGEFVRVLASLGGHNDRASEAPPGPQAMWVGIGRMTDFAIAWNTFGPGGQTCV